MLKTSSTMSRLPESRVKVIAISAGKGGVGKSCVSLNLALALAQSSQHVLLFDADLGLANIDTMLGLSVSYNLSHVLQGMVKLADIIVTGPGGIRIIPSASGTDYMSGLTVTEHAGIINAFNELTEPFDYLIVDTAAGISDTVLSFLRSSDEMVLVICDEPTSLTDSYALMKVMNKRFNSSHFHIITNKVANLKEGRELFARLDRAVGEFLELHLNYLGAIPYDKHVQMAVKKQEAVLIAYPQSQASKAFYSIAKTVEALPIKHLLDGNTRFFLEKSIVRGKRPGQHASHDNDRL